MSIGSKMKELRLAQGYEQQVICEFLNIEQSTLSNYENNRRTPKLEMIPKIADFFGVSTDYLLGKSESKTDLTVVSNLSPIPKTKKVPLLGKIACEEPITDIKNMAGFVDIPDWVNADFALICKDDSMMDARIYNGDTVYIQQQSEVENGEIAAVLIDGEAVLKRIYYQNNKIILQPENKNYEPLVFINEEIAEVKILGKAIHFTSKVR